MSLVNRSFRALLVLGLASGALARCSQSSFGGGSHGDGGWLHGEGGWSQGWQGFGHHGPTNINYNPGIYLGFSPWGSYVYSPPLIVVGSGGLPSVVLPVSAPVPVPVAIRSNAGAGPLLPPPPPGLLEPNTPKARRLNPSRAKELVEVGDRSFRVNNIKRAEEKYGLAVKADPTAPAPHVHLAQVSLARGDYSASADHLRDAVTVATNGGWLLNVPDIQAVFAEPADFAKQLARLESHLQANPNDRDAWFVLGAECYLSGRSKRAFDVFQRLTDRKPDEALAAFLDASKPKPPAVN